MDASRLSRKQAAEIARRWLALRQQDSDGWDELMLVEDAATESPSAWAFTFQSKRFVETRDMQHLVIGGPAVIVDKFDGSAHETPDSRHPKAHLGRYEQERGR